MARNPTARVVTSASILIALACGCGGPAEPAPGAADDRTNWPKSQEDKAAAKAAAIKAARKR